MRIIFMGTPSYAAKILESLLASHEIVALVCQLDRIAKRGQIAIPQTKSLLLSKHKDIPIFQPSCFDAQTIKALQAIACDVIVVAAYGKMLPVDVLNHALCLNVHASLLPKYRGASPIQMGILKQDQYHGVSVMKMEEGLDCGDVLGYGVVKNQGQSKLALFDELAFCGAELLAEVLANLARIEPLAQRDCEMSYCKKIQKTDGLVDFGCANEIYLKWLAYEDWPGVFLESGLKLLSIDLGTKEGEHRVGEILCIQEKGVLVGCNQGSLWIKMLQAPSKKAMSAVQYLNGKRLRVGDVLV